MAAKKEKKELALVLSSGGSKGAFHIGVINILEKNNISPNVVIGSSVGALVGGVYAAGCLDKFENVLIKKTKKEMDALFKVWPSKEGLIRTKRLEDELRKILGNRKIEELDKKFIAVAVDLISGNKVIIEKGDLCNAIMASMAIPILFPPVHTGEMLLADGSLEAPLDVTDGFRYAKKVFAVDATRRIENMPKKSSYNYIDIFQRALTIVQSEVLTEALKRHSRYLMILKIPGASINTSTLDFSKAKEAIAIGESETEKHLDEIKALLSRE